MAKTTIPAGYFAAGSIATADIAANAITSAKLAQNSVLTKHIDDNQVGIDQLNVSDGSDGQVLTTNGSGTLSFSTVSGTTINNNADNRVITGSGTANTLEAESSFTFDGTTTVINNTGNADSTLLQLKNTPSTAGTYKTGLEFWSNEGTANNQTYNAGRIFSEFDGSNYSDSRLTLGSASGGGSFNNEISLKNGKVGIGTTSPGVDLEIATSTSDTGVDLTLNGNKSSNGAVGSIIFENNTDSVAMIRASRVGGNNDAADMQFYTQATGGSNSERMRIDSSGFIGMGTTTPSSYNSYADNLVVADSAHCGISIVAGNTSLSTLMFADGTGGTAGYRGRVGYDHNTDSMVLHTAAAERLTLDSSGRVIVASGGAIHFSGNTSTGFIYETGANLQLRSDGAMTFYTYSGGWQVRMTIADGGLISGDFNDTSDVALKENIVAIDNGMSVISQMRPVSFDWRDVVAEDKDGNEVTVPSGKGSTKGLIAQEVEAIDAELVVGEEGEKAINTSGVLAYAIKAIQELEARIATLES